MFTVALNINVEVNIFNISSDLFFNISSNSQRNLLSFDIKYLKDKSKFLLSLYLL